MTLASVLIHAGRAGPAAARRRRARAAADVRAELREDVNVLNVVNFGGGTYVLYAEVLDDGEIEVDTEPYSDTFDRPARLLPIEAKALVAAIDLLGDHLPGRLAGLRAREDRRRARRGPGARGPAGRDRAAATTRRSRASSPSAIEDRRLLELDYYVENEDRFSAAQIEPYALMNGREGWYVSAYDPAKEDMRHFRLDRIKRARSSTTHVRAAPRPRPARRHRGLAAHRRGRGSRVAHVWISADQARWAREERTVIAELEDGAIVVEWAFKGERYLVKEVLREAGDAAVLEPADVREAVLAAAERACLRGR